MAFRIQLFFAYATLCLLSLYSADAFTLFKPAKAVSVPFLQHFYFSLFQQPRIAAFTWSNCGPSTDPDQIKSLSVAPDPIQTPGKII